MARKLCHGKGVHIKNKKLYYTGGKHLQFPIKELIPMGSLVLLFTSSELYRKQET